MTSCFIRSFGLQKTRGNNNYNKDYFIKSVKRDFTSTFNNKIKTKEKIDLSVKFVPKLSVNSQNYLKKNKENNFRRYFTTKIENEIKEKQNNENNEKNELKEKISEKISKEEKEKEEKSKNNEVEEEETKKIFKGEIVNEEVSEKLDRRVYSIALSSFLMGTAIGIIIPVMPTFADQIGINTLQYGTVLSVMGITRLIFNIPAAWAADRFGRKPALVGGPVVSSIGMALTGTAHGMNELMFYRFLIGAGGSFQMTGAQLYLTDISNPKNRARTMSPLMAAFSAGSALGPAVGGFLLERFGVRPLFFIVGGCMAIISLNNYTQLNETKPILQSADDKKKKLDLIFEFKNTLVQWRELIKNSDMRAALSVHCSYWFAASGCTFTLMPLFAYSNLGLSATALGSYFTLMSIINMSGSQVGAYFLDKFGRKKGIVPGFMILSIAATGMMHSTNGTELMCWLILWSMGATVLGTAPSAYVTDITTPSNRSQALAMLRSAGDLGLFLGAGLMAGLAYSTSIEVAMGFCSSILFISGCHFGFFARETIVRKKK